MGCQHVVIICATMYMAARRDAGVLCTRPLTDTSKSMAPLEQEMASHRHDLDLLPKATGPRKRNPKKLLTIRKAKEIFYWNNNNNPLVHQRPRLFYFLDSDIHVYPEVVQDTRHDARHKTRQDTRQHSRIVRWRVPRLRLGGLGGVGRRCLMPGFGGGRLGLGCG